jgi:NADPH:quinone reductase-like Zn-dependent oxidoreductase
MKLRYKVLNVILIVLAVAVISLALLLSHDSPCGTAPPLPAGANSMQAMVYRCYGSPDVVKLEELPKPVLADDRVLVRVRAASINPLDWHYMRGKPYIIRPMVGFGAPHDVRLGVDFAGTIEAVGRSVTQYKPGDEVFGGATGALAQYVTPRAAGSLALKPANISFEQAAAVPIAGVTALQALRDEGKVQAGQKVLINGASGGVGTFAVQIAKAFGAEVTGVCSTRNVALVQSLGADHVIDYTREDFTKGSQHYDVLIDIVGNHTLREFVRVLNPNGRLVMVGGSSESFGLSFVSGFLKIWLLSKFVSQKMGFYLANLNHEDLDTLRGLMQAGKVTPAIDRQYPLSQTPEAMRYLEGGHARGKVVLTVE